MVEKSVEIVIRTYLEAVRNAGLHVRRAVLFGSHAEGKADKWSDIDLVVIAPELETPVDRSLVAKLWELRADIDSRIEPIPCGEREWEMETNRPIIEIARRQGIVILA